MRFNEVHYTRAFLKHLESSLTRRKKPYRQVPSYITVEMAKATGMYREDLVVGKHVVVVPTLSANEARAQHGAAVSPASEEDSVPVTPAPAPAPTPADDSDDEHGRHLLVIGAANDTRRANELRRWFTSVTYIKDLRNVRQSSEWVRELTVANKQIHRVCIDHSGFTPATFETLIFGSRASCAPGDQLISFVSNLKRLGVLAFECVLQFPRHDHNGNWEASMTRWETEFGDVRHVNRYESPLCAADTATGLGEVDLTFLTGGQEPPLCQFIVNKPSVPLVTPTHTNRFNRPDLRFSINHRRRRGVRFSPRARRTLLPRGDSPDVSTAPDVSPPDSAPRLSPEGMEAVASIQNLKTGADASSAYVEALEQVTDRLAQEKSRLVKKLERCLKDIELCIQEIERERGEPFTSDQRRKLMDDIRAANPVENDTQEPIFCDLLG